LVIIDLQPMSAATSLIPRQKYGYAVPVLDDRNLLNDLKLFDAANPLSQSASRTRAQRIKRMGQSRAHPQQLAQLINSLGL
jgi:hypothetical protein